jgi:hypothetical protein
MKLNVLLEATVEEYEARLADAQHTIDEYLQAGEIIKPEFDKLKGVVGRAIEEIANKTIAQPYFHGSGNKWYDIDQSLGSLAYDLPHNAHDMLSFGKKLAKVKAKDQPPYRAAAAFFEKYKSIAEKMRELKGKVVTTAKKREDKKIADTKERDRSFNDSTTLVGVLKEHMGDYIAKAEELAGEQYDKWMAYLAKHGWDLDVVAPEPETKMSREQYQKMKRRREIIENMTDRDGGTHNLRKASSAKRKERVDRAHNDAEASYMEWIHKLIRLIGKPVETAQMEGNPWSGSILRVKCNDGEQQAYKTQMIINFSKYQLAFNQFPTRRIK